MTEPKPAGEKRPARAITFLRGVAVLVILSVSVGTTAMVVDLGAPGRWLGELGESLVRVSYLFNLVLCGTTFLGLAVDHG